MDGAEVEEPEPEAGVARSMTLLVEYIAWCSDG